jgi:hypothetical protein
MLYIPQPTGNASQREQVEWLRRTVAYAVFSIDTVELKIPYEPDPDQLDELQQSCRGKNRPPEQDKPSEHQPRPWWKIFLTAPTPEAIKLIIKWDWRYRLVRVDPAVDWITRTKAEAFQLQDWFLDHATFRGNRGKCVRYEGEYVTDYVGNRKANGISHAWYGDRLSKWAKAPCLHYGTRNYGNASKEKLGITALQRLLTFDVKRYLSSERHPLVFCEADEGKLGRRLNNRKHGTRRRKLEAEDYELKGRIFRAGKIESLQDAVNKLKRGAWLTDIDEEAKGVLLCTPCMDWR